MLGNLLGLGKKMMKMMMMMTGDTIDYTHRALDTTKLKMRVCVIGRERYRQSHLLVSLIEYARIDL